MIDADLYNQKGEKSGKVKLTESVFGIEAKKSLIKQVYVAQKANARVAIAHTKTRGEVRGGGAKPWRQKGTGRARHGSIRSPLWIGGGVTFGPRNDRNFSKKINKKQKQKALFMVLSSKLSDKEIFILDALSFGKTTTKEAAKFLDIFTNKVLNKKYSVKTLIILPEKNEELHLSFRNIPQAKIIYADSLNVGDLLDYKYAVILKDSLDVVNNTYVKLNK